MARPCALCGGNLDIIGDRHRCVGGRPAGDKPPTRLEKDQIARGELDPAALKSKPQAQAQPVGRLAPRLAAVPISQPRRPQANAARQSEGHITCADVLAAIAELRREFEKLAALLTPRTDA
jgi:hypothetical protein